MKIDRLSRNPELVTEGAAVELPADGRHCGRSSRAECYVAPMSPSLRTPASPVPSPSSISKPRRASRSGRSLEATSPLGERMRRLAHAFIVWPHCSGESGLSPGLRAAPLIALGALDEVSHAHLSRLELAVVRSTILSPATRPCTQISQGVRGTIGPTRATRLHNHSPP
jgi:hypothetical protein